MDVRDNTGDFNSTGLAADPDISWLDVELHVPVKIEPDDDEDERGEGGDDFSTLNEQGLICEIPPKEESLLNPYGLLDKDEDENITLVEDPATPHDIEVPITPPLISMTTDTDGVEESVSSSSLQENVSLYQNIMPPPPKFFNKKQFTSEMDQSIQDIVNECISVLHKDPREYHPFYLRVYKYTTIGRTLGFIKFQKEVNSLWKKYDDFAEFQFRKWESDKDEFYFNGEHSPYLTYVLTRKVIVEGKQIRRKGDQKERNLTFRRVNSLVRKLRREWREAGGIVEIKNRLERRLQFFEEVKHITYPGDTVTINKYWSCLIDGFPKRRKEETEQVPPLKRSKRERKVPSRFYEPPENEKYEKRKVKKNVKELLNSEKLDIVSEDKTKGMEEPTVCLQEENQEEDFGMSVEEKREFRRHWAKTYRKDMTAEEAEQVRKYHREKYYAKLASMTKEELDDFKAKRRFYELQRRLKMQQMSEEEKERRRTINYVKKQAYLASKPKEWLEEKVEQRRKKTKEKVEAMTEEQKEEVNLEQ